jgi:hypothetical protein
LGKDNNSLWNGETYELLPSESASFNLEYHITTGPLDGAPHIVFGVHVKYHNDNGDKLDVYSDSIYQFLKGNIEQFNIMNIHKLNNTNSFQHMIFLQTLQALSNVISNNRKYITKLMKNEYRRGFRKLNKLLVSKSDKITIKKTQKNIEDILKKEIKKPLEGYVLQQKDDLLSSLNMIAVKNNNTTFFDLCIFDT